MRAVAVQLASGPDKAANLASVVDALGGALADGADLVVLPEAIMAGFGTAETDLVPLAEPLDGPFVQAVAGALAGSRATAVAGMFECPPPGRPEVERRVFNTAVVVRAGGVVAAYRKVHLFDALGWHESDRVLPGDPASLPVVVEVAGMAIGVMTCYDLRFPETARRLVDAGATVLVVPAAWVAGPHKAEQWQVLVRARAVESTAYVVGAGQPGPEFGGQSMAVDPWGEVLGRLGSEEPGRLVADLDPATVEQVRQALPVLVNRRYSTAGPVPSPVAG